MSFVFLIIGLAMTIFGSNYLVDGSSALAKKLNMSDLVIGLTIVALGTSTPELTVSIYASFSGSTDLAIGNIVGSNNFNIAIILGIAAVVYPISVQKSSVRIEIPLTILAAILIFIMANDQWLGDPESKNIISRSDGIILLAFFIIFMYYSFSTAQTDPEIGVENEASKKLRAWPMWKCLVYVTGGLIGLFLGGKLLVDGAVDIAQMIGMSESTIGLTIVAAGTSMPELATSAMAAYKKNSDMALGNVLGSNLFNTFLILGTSSTIYPLPFNSEINNTDVYINIASTIIVLLSVLLLGRGRKFGRIEGMILVTSYVVYIGYLII